MTASTLRLTSTAFAENASIPAAYTCDGSGGNPPLSISGVPEGTQSLALVMRDIDVPKQFNTGGEFVHWVLFNMSPETTEIPETSAVGTPGSSGAGKPTYTAPCPPPQYEPSEHRYVFDLYALDTRLPLGEGVSKQQLLAAMEGHILAQTQLAGKYRRK